jgi:hypothetical protein
MNAENMKMAFELLYIVAGYVTLALIGAYGFLVVHKIWNGDIKLEKLLSEPNGDASLARFQFLIFTFVIALSLFLVVVGQDRPAFPAVIPATVLALLGISGSSYLVSKSIQFSDPGGLYPSAEALTITPGKVTVHAGQTQQFQATLSNNPETQPKVKWEVVFGFGTIDDNGLYTADVTKGPGAPPAAVPPAKPPACPPTVHATVQATVEGHTELTDMAVVTILS